jgi:putative restriction endonuclease
VFPRKGARVWYMTISATLIARSARAMMFDYAFMGTDPNSADNRWLRDAMQQQIPVIFFLGTDPG